MTFPLIISWHTPDNLYTGCAQRLKASLDKFGLEHEINCLPARGDWNQNVCQKPEYILRMMVKHPDRNIVWLDADSNVVAYPSYFGEIQGDVGCLLWEGKQIFLSTAYFANTPKVRDFMRHWINLTKDHIYSFSPEQYSFKLALKDFPEVSFERLPDTYAYVKNESPNNVPPVILAELVSRYGGFCLYPRKD